MTRPARLILAAIAMSAVLAAMVALHAHNRASGTEIELPMEPVDPRDLLLGHYVEIRTPLHRLDTRGFDAPHEGWQPGDTVFVALQPGADGHWQPAAIHRSEPPARSGELYLRGRVHHAFTRREHETAETTAPDGENVTTRRPVEGSAHTELSVRYNLERYYADREAALELESLRNQDRLALIVSVGPQGDGVIKGLRIDGEAHYDSLF